MFAADLANASSATHFGTARSCFLRPDLRFASLATESSRAFNAISFLVNRTPATFAGARIPIFEPVGLAVVTDRRDRVTKAKRRDHLTCIATPDWLAHANGFSAPCAMRAGLLRQPDVFACCGHFFTRFFSATGDAAFTETAAAFVFVGSRSSAGGLAARIL